MGGASRMFKDGNSADRRGAIWDIVKRFGNAARIMKEAGFTGCQIHGAHGYLVSQFLSPNQQHAVTDKWGGVHWKTEPVLSWKSIVRFGSK